MPNIALRVERCFQLSGSAEVVCFGACLIGPQTTCIFQKGTIVFRTYTYHAVHYDQFATRLADHVQAL